MKSESSSKGFSLFTPLVGTTLVIMAIVISAGMLQNDIRISRSLTSSYEVSVQSLLAKLIKAGAEVQILSNMERVTYEQVSLPFECDNDLICQDKIRNRLIGTDLTMVDSVYSNLMNFDGLFGELIDAINTVLGGTGTNYKMQDSSAVRGRISSALSAMDDPSDVDEPIEFGFDEEGRYYVKINEEKFSQRDFALRFEDQKTRDSMEVSIAPYGFNFTTEEPLGLLVGNASAAFLASDSSNLEDSLETHFDSFTVYGAAWFKEDSGKRLIVQFYKGYGGTMFPFNITFQTPGFSAAMDDNDLECDANFACS